MYQSSQAKQPQSREQSKQQEHASHSFPPQDSRQTQTLAAIGQSTYQQQQVRQAKAIKNAAIVQQLKGMLGRMSPAQASDKQAAPVQMDVSDAYIYCAHAQINHPWHADLRTFLDLLKQLGPNHTHYWQLKAALSKNMRQIDVNIINEDLKDVENQGQNNTNTNTNNTNTNSGNMSSWGSMLEQYTGDDYHESDDESYDILEDEPMYKQPKSKKKIRKKKSLPDTMETYDMFKPKNKYDRSNMTDKLKERDKLKKKKGFIQRPNEYGSVSVNMETINHVSGQKIQRPTNVQGYVYPTTTKGRPNAPEPISGIRVGVQWKEVGNGIHRNTGIVDSQKGHIMALELGGPDLPYNIVPQWGQWQANGVWRKMEMAVLEQAEAAEKRGNRLFFDAEIKYKQYKYKEQGTLKGITFPVAFLVQVEEHTKQGKLVGKGKTVFDAEQQQDQTDIKLAWRVMDKVDQEIIDFSTGNNTSNNGNNGNNGNNNGNNSNQNSDETMWDID